MEYSGYLQHWPCMDKQHTQIKCMRRAENYIHCLIYLPFCMFRVNWSSLADQTLRVWCARLELITLAPPCRINCHQAPQYRNVWLHSSFPLCMYNTHILSLQPDLQHWFDEMLQPFRQWLLQLLWEWHMCATLHTSLSAQQQLWLW